MSKKNEIKYLFTCSYHPKKMEISNRYTPERIAWEKEIERISAIETSIDIYQRLNTFRNLESLLTNWKIGMIQSLIDTDEIEYDVNGCYS